MDRFDIQKLRQLPIESVAERLGLRVTRHKALCPFHPDSHPSLSFSVARNAFKCFVCGAHGGTIDLAMKLLASTGRSGGASFRQTCEWLAGEHNVILTEYPPAAKPTRHYPPDVEYLSSLVAHPVLNEAARTFLFDQRRLNPKVIEWCGISSISHPTPSWRYGRPFYDAPSLLFPYRDIHGHVLNVQSRYLGTESGKPRFRFPAHSSLHIFNLPILRYLHEGEPLYLAEGITDCLALLSSGHKAIAIPSATTLKADDLAPLRGANLHIFPDADQPGERLYHSLLSIATTLGASLTRHPLPDGCKDYSEWYLKASLNHSFTF